MDSLLTNIKCAWYASPLLPGSLQNELIAGVWKGDSKAIRTLRLNLWETLSNIPEDERWKLISLFVVPNTEGTPGLHNALLHYPDVASEFFWIINEFIIYLPAGHTDKLMDLLEAKNKKGETALCIALSKGKTDAIDACKDFFCRFIGEKTFSNDRIRLIHWFVAKDANGIPGPGIALINGDATIVESYTWMLSEFVPRAFSDDECDALSGLLDVPKELHAACINQHHDTIKNYGKMLRSLLPQLPKDAYKKLVDVLAAKDLSDKPAIQMLMEKGDAKTLRILLDILIRLLKDSNVPDPVREQLAQLVVNAMPWFCSALKEGHAGVGTVYGEALGQLLKLELSPDLRKGLVQSLFNGIESLCQSLNNHHVQAITACGKVFIAELLPCVNPQDADKLIELVVSMLEKTNGENWHLPAMPGWGEVILQLLQRPHHPAGIHDRLLKLSEQLIRGFATEIAGKSRAAVIVKFGDVFPLLLPLICSGKNTKWQEDLPKYATNGLITRQKDDRAAVITTCGTLLNQLLHFPQFSADEYLKPYNLLKSVTEGFCFALEDKNATALQECSKVFTQLSAQLLPQLSTEECDTLVNLLRPHEQILGTALATGALITIKAVVALCSALLQLKQLSDNAREMLLNCLAAKITDGKDTGIPGLFVFMRDFKNTQKVVAELYDQVFLNLSGNDCTTLLGLIEIDDLQNVPALLNDMLKSNKSVITAFNEFNKEIAFWRSNSKDAERQLDQAAQYIENHDYEQAYHIYAQMDHPAASLQLGLMHSHGWRAADTDKEKELQALRALECLKLARTKGHRQASYTISEFYLTQFRATKNSVHYDLVIHWCQIAGDIDLNPKAALLLAEIQKEAPPPAVEKPVKAGTRHDVVNQKPKPFDGHDDL